MENQNKKSFLRFLEPIKIKPLIYIKSFFISFIWGINAIIHIYFLERITFYLENSDKQNFLDMLIYYVYYIVFYLVINFFIKKWGWVETVPKTIGVLGDYYIKKFVKLDNNSVEKYGTGKLISIINGGFGEWGYLLFDLIERGTYLIISLIFTLFMLTKVGTIYVFIFLGLYIFFQIISAYINTFLLKHRLARYEAKKLYSGQLVKILMSKNEIMQSSKIDKEIGILNKYIKKSVEANRNIAKYMYWFFNIPELGIISIIIGSFYFFGLQVLAGELSLSVLVGISGALIIMQRAIKDSIIFYKDFTKRFVDIERLWNFFDETPEIEGYETGKEFKFKKGDIEIKNMNFSYEENNLLFENFNLKLEAKKITAFVGNSGSGKSTLVKLIAGYLKQNSGEIIIDNQNLSKISLKSYYKNIGYLTQEPSVFDGTILENLTYGLPHPLAPSPLGGDGEYEEIKEIIEKSKCEFIYDFKDGINTEIGEKGIRLSGGQRQRLAIAKIMLKDPKIIILDEPTSALDSFSEEKISESLNNLFAGRTVIIIAHRLQTVKHADKIFVFENGKIVEEGNHKTLVEKKGIYNKMLELQSGF